MAKFIFNKNPLILVYPEVEKFSPDEMKNAMDLIVNVNPYIISTRFRDRETKIYTSFYKIEPMRVNLIPGPKNLKKYEFPKASFY